MTARERYLKTFRGEKTDRMPVSLFIVEQGHYLSQLYPGTDPYDHERQFRELVEYNRQLGADVFVRLLADLYEPALHVIYGGVDIWQSTDVWQVTTTEHQKGNSRVLESSIRTPGGTLTQSFTINQSRPGTFMYGCTDFPVKTESDLDLVIQYEPPMPQSYPGIVEKATRRTKALVGNDGIVGAWVPFGVFNNASQLIRHEQLYALFLTDKPFYKKLMDFSLERFKPYAQAILDGGCDVAHAGGNVPGGFLGRKNYDKYILPYEKQMVDFLQKDGCVCMYHNCGTIMKLVESYRELGAIAVEPFSPVPLGDTDLAAALEIVNGAYTVTAGVDQVNVLQNGTVADTIKATREVALLGQQKGQGRFIIQNADFMEYGTPPENVQAFVQTAMEFAQYE
ncbi:hypothetical protein LJB76_02050 [Clostridia bacterium OttesenSCG-928-O13]|nr:hypothetical protein [Clostridia bacterium OttesenSCG-928-O13]